MKPIKRNFAVDLSEIDSQTFDSQYSPAATCGKNQGQDVDVLRFLQKTMPLDDTVRLEDTFETQVANLGGETQVLDDTDCVENTDTQLLVECNNEGIVDSDGEETDRTDVLGDTDETSDGDSTRRVGDDPGDLTNMIQGAVPFNDTVPLEDASETQMMNLDGETEALDGSPCVENMGTQLLVECDNDVVDDSDGEGTIRTEVLGYQESSGNDSTKRTHNDPVDVENMKYTTICKQNNRESKAESDAYNEQHSSELEVHTSTPLDKATAGPKTGSVRKGFTSVRAASIRASGLAARRKFFEGTNSGSCSARSNCLSVKEHITENDGIPFVRDSFQSGEQDQERVLGDYNEQVKRINNENECRLGSSAARKLFGEDDFAEIKEPNGQFDNGAGGADLPQLFACDKELAGLSYVDSQEPGESSQANALDFVDRFLKFNVTEYDQEADLGKSTGDKSKPVSSAKGIQSLARRANYQNTVSRVFDWDDNCEDEGGGDFFSRMKESFFENGGQSKNSFTKIQKLRRPDSRGSAANNKSNDNVERLGTHEINTSGVHSSSKLNFHDKKGNGTTSKRTGRKVGKNIIKDVDELLNVDSSDASEATGMETGMPDMLNVGFDTQMAAEAMEALCHGIDNSDCNPEEHLATNECRHNRPSEVVKKGKKGKSKKINDTDESDECRITASSSGRKSVKKQHLEDFGTVTPVARRTRQQKKAISHSGNASTDVREGINDLTEVAALKGKRKRSTKVVDSLEVSNSREEFCRVSSILSGEPDNSKLSEHKQPGQKLTGKSAALKIDHLRFPKGRRTRRKLSGQFNINDMSVKRQTRSSTCAGSFLCSLDLQYEQRLLQQSVVRGHSGDSALNNNTPDRNGKNTNLKDVDGVRASQQGVKKSVADKTSSAEIVGVNARLDPSPRQGCKPPGLECVTPIGCRTPVNEASPICMGDEYLKQSCRKNLARVSLMKEIDSLIDDGLQRTSSLKDSRKRKEMASVRALFSRHLDDYIIKQQKKILARLGASIASSISDATHFITDSFVRTRNMLEAIAFGKPVVTYSWLESCGQASCFIDEKNYILRDAKKEKEFGFSLPVSLARACQSPLLQGQKVLITPHTKPGKEVLASLVKAVHGLPVERIGRSALKDDRIPDDLLVLSCEEDYTICVPFLEKGAAVYSSELLLNGIVTQKLEYQRHRLFADNVKRTRSTIWLKKDSNRFVPVCRK